MAAERMRPEASTALILHVLAEGTRLRNDSGWKSSLFNLDISCRHSLKAQRLLAVERCSFKPAYAVRQAVLLALSESCRDRTGE